LLPAVARAFVVGLAVLAAACGGTSPPPLDSATGGKTGGGGAGTGGAVAAGVGGAVAGVGGSVAPSDAGARKDAATARDADTGAVDARPTPDVAPTPDARPPADGGAPDVVSTDGGTWHLVWSDEFDTDGAPNPSNWGFERGFVRNQELQWYQPDNAKVSGGLLTIDAEKVHIANPNYLAGSTDWKRNRQFYDYTSTSMTTSGKRAFTYGRFEMRARIDIRQGSWPAFWILGSGVSWPQSGEVDIMEYYASKVLANVCEPSGSTCLWASTNRSPASLGANWADQFHVWAMEWDAQRIDLYLDEKLVNHFVVSSAVAASQTNPYIGHSMYILVNLALGGNGGDPAPTPFPIHYEVDYVRVYQK
jgi:beta-glucanase (GH16 family)